MRKKFFTHKKLNRRDSFSRFAKKKFAKSSTREESPALQCLSEVFLDMSQWGRTPVNGRLFCSHQGKLLNEQILFFKDYLSRKIILAIGMWKDLTRNISSCATGFSNKAHLREDLISRFGGVSSSWQFWHFVPILAYKREFFLWSCRQFFRMHGNKLIRRKILMLTFSTAA